MAAKFETIDDVMKVLYAAISGPPGEQDWEGNREIYHADALITRTRIVDGLPAAFSFNFDEFVEATIPLLAGRSFHEIETDRVTDIFGQIAHCYSAYVARETPDSPEVEFRGVNMVHLWNDGIVGADGTGVKADGSPSRWWIMSIIWDNEREGLTLPDRWGGVRIAD